MAATVTCVYQVNSQIASLAQIATAIGAGGAPVDTTLLQLCGDATIASDAVAGGGGGQQRTIVVNVGAITNARFPSNAALVAAFTNWMTTVIATSARCSVIQSTPVVA